MTLAVFSTNSYDREFLDAANAPAPMPIVYHEARLTSATASLAEGASAVCVFVNDVLDAACIAALARVGVRLVALRCAGFNNVDLEAAHAHDVTVARVPAYSPAAVAEHTIGLILTLNRNIHRAHARVREGNFSLSGLMGFNLEGRTVGVVGAGKIGENVVRILTGFGCRVLVLDPHPNPACEALGARFVTRDELLVQSDVVTLHCPLTPQTRHLIDEAAIARLKPGAMIVNTSRGGVIDTRAVIKGLKSGRIGSLALDVYEEEGDIFFRDLSDVVLQDDVFARLLTFPNVLITAHQAFFTHEAMTEIAQTTLANVRNFQTSGAPLHAVSVEKIA
jgi:D-lactate dehydrogenase